MSLDDVAKVTKIQPRILERLEAGKLDGLPAEVFVRGFVRSFARCVGLDEREALRRYAACGEFASIDRAGSRAGSQAGSPAGAMAAGSSDITPTVRALVEAMAELAPGSATAARATPRKMNAVEVIDLADGTAHPTALEVAAAVVPAPAMPAAVSGETRASDDVVTAALDEAAPAQPGMAALSDGDADIAVDAALATTRPAAVEPVAAISADRARLDREPSKKKRGRRAKRNKRMSRDRIAVGTPAGASPVVTAPPGSAIASGTWAPRMPPIASTPSVPWRRPIAPVASASASVPSLVIDDADPESAERVLEERAEKHAPRRSFLPPILLDREDRSARQGGLTLAVIILLIAATLTLSYLMRRPSASGDGMTRSPVSPLSPLSGPSAWS